MTLKDWNNRQDIKRAWKAFYSSEAGQALKNILISLGCPAPVMPPAGVDFIDWNASLNTRREGYFEVIRLLSALSEDSSTPEELPDPWENKTETNQE